MSRKRFYPQPKVSHQAALDAVLGILESHPLSLFCPNHRSVMRAVEYIERKGHKLACGCVRATELGQPEPSVIKLAQLWHCFDQEASKMPLQTQFQPRRDTRRSNPPQET